MQPEAERFPLYWPVGRLRTKAPRKSSFRAPTLALARNELLHELDLAGALPVTTVISTNMRARTDGLLIPGPQPDDRGAAVYFNRLGRPYVLACDKWDRVEDNLWALRLHVKALRDQERWGVGTIEQAFAGFAALPPASDLPRTRQWREVLDLNPAFPGPGVDVDDATDLIGMRFKKLALLRHPDHGGNDAQMAELTAARDIALAEVRRG